MLRTIGFVIILALASAAHAQPAGGESGTHIIGQTPIGGGTVAIAPPDNQTITTPATTTSKVTGSQTTIETTAPVTSNTKISIGSIASEALLWVASVFGTTIGAALTALFLRMLKNAGIQGTDLLRQRLQEIVINGINAGAKAAAEHLQDKETIEIKNAAVAHAVEYVQEHGADTLKSLGIDPNSNAAVDAIKARIETAINDPATPTPAVITPQPVAAAA